MPHEPHELRPLRAVEERADTAAAPVQGAGIQNEQAELVADLIEATGLVAVDRLALVRGAARQGATIAEALVSEGLASSEGVARMLAARHRLPLVDLRLTGVSADASTHMPVRVLRRAVALPYRLEGDVLHVALADPQNVQAIDELRLATRYQLSLGVASRDEITAELDRLDRVSDAVIETLEDTEPEDDDAVSDLEEDDGVSDGPIVRIVNSIMLEAAEDGASDVHFEAQEDGLLVRFRIDGVLHEMQRIPKQHMAGVTTRLKVLAKMDIAERRKPQDGRISLRAASAGRLLDIRMATLPTVSGETVVLRLLDKSKQAPSLEVLGMSDEMRATFGSLIARPTGAIFVTGPTGSGKSTSLYAALTQIARPEINVITVEDPVEYRLAGVNQMQINVRAGLTFATALRSILRSDPDVVMVGEVRDGETAKMAIEAALTGHLVLSTLHTNDAPSTLTRLNEMGVEPFLTASAVSAVLAQRLARKLCTHCCEMYTPSVEELIEARVEPDAAVSSDGTVLYRKRGCPRCNQTGYKGRIGIFQLMLMNEGLAELAVRRASRDEVAREAMSSGMKTLWDDGMAKVASGLTSIEELARVTV
ncbi:MAG TPA: GspE/PulE family protein [Gaiellaceae bacterium]|jgi:type IV pilus assembly protein PilB